MQEPKLNQQAVNLINWDYTELLSELTGLECHITETALQGGEDFPQHWKRYYETIQRTKPGNEPPACDLTQLYKTHATVWTVGGWGPVEKRLR